jgi:hypothetical protein
MAVPPAIAIGAVLGNAQVCRLVGFDQREERLDRRGPDFGERAFEVLGKGVVQTPAPA